MDRTQILVAKSRMGDLTDAEEAELRDALLGLAPSSPEFRAVADALKARNPSGFVERGSEGTGGGGGIASFGDAAYALAGLHPGTRAVFHGGPLEEEGNIPVTPPPGTKGLDPAQPSPAEEPEATAGAGFAPLDFPGGGGNAAAQHADYMSGTQAGLEEVDLMEMMPQGTFSGGGPHAIDIYSRNPDAYLTKYAEERGGGANMAAYLADPYMSALAMSRAGLLGGGYGDTMFSGSGMGEAQNLANAEEFLNDYNQPGQFVDPGRLMEEMIGRGSRTDFSNRISPQTNLPYTPEEIVDLTNESVMAAAPFMGPGGAEYLKSALQGAGIDYINMIASGEAESTLTYPQYLKQIGLDKLLT